MKKTALMLMAACLSLTFLPLASFGSSTNYPGIMNKTTPVPVNSNALVARINAIKNMDRSSMSSSEKKALRKELRTMKRENRRSHSGVYLTIGVLLIVIVLLILLL